MEPPLSREEIRRLTIGDPDRFLAKVQHYYWLNIKKGKMGPLRCGHDDCLRAVFGEVFIWWDKRLKNPSPLVFFEEAAIWRFIGVVTRYKVMTATCDRFWRGREQRLEDVPQPGTRNLVTRGRTASRRTNRL